MCGWTCECLCALVFCVASACSVAHRAETYLYTRTPTLQKSSPVTFWVFFLFPFFSPPTSSHHLLMSHVVSRPPFASHHRRPSPGQVSDCRGACYHHHRRNACSWVTFECRAELNRADRSGSLLPKRRESLLAVAQSLTLY